ncbi:acyl-CoA thioesterase domain-containing protein [Rhodococcus sp. IEGM 1408]|uniref:acyl-CoA thioesterase domain-containing protein n=1 Tax=Rhodococcus sp. IEGM 1408 TaxID=3082220 RepID=UPI0029543118|nr:acyl-CoA thioesterase domain-containing protein [Rhodococcus sp. IEGM 1408]MDV8001992.1 thioesterase family protein [Rhodococcus sp. IEGM 1408]
MSERSFFTLDSSGAYIPTRYARSAWSETMVNGPAVVVAAARALESEHGAQGFQPARLTVDLFAPVRTEPLVAVTEEIRSGNRIRVADVKMMQGGETVARGTLVQLRRGEQPHGQVWRSGRHVEPPAEADSEQARPGSNVFFGSGDADESWSRDMGAHQNDQRKRFWHHPLDVVAGESATPFQRAVTLAESTSLMSHWGDEGIGFINADLTVALARLPRSGDIGIEADEHLSDAGVAVGSASLFDRDGVFGTGTVVAVSNAGRQIDFTRRRAGTEDSGSIGSNEAATRV